MKKILLTAFAVVLFMSLAYAQNKIRFGAKAGINVSVFTKQIDGFGGGPQTALYGFHKFPRFSINAGFTADINIKQNFSFTAEFLYSGQGSAYRIKNDYVVITNNRGTTEDAYDYIRFRINSLEIPLLAKHTFYRPNKTSYALYGGFAPAVNISSDTRFSYYDLDRGSPSNVPVTSESEELNNVRGFNVSGVLGLQIGTASVDRGFYTDIRLAQTLMPVFTSNARMVNNPRMFVGSLGIGYRF
jgi:hypothetical protein